MFPRLLIIGMIALLMAACTGTQPTPTAAPVLPLRLMGAWQTVHESLGIGEVGVRWQFVGHVGDEISIHLESDSALETALIGAQDVVLVQPLTGVVVLPADGAYAVELRRTDDLMDKMTYSLTLEVGNLPSPTFTPSLTPTRTPTRTLTPTPTLTPSRTSTRTHTSTATLTPTRTLTPTHTVTPTDTSTFTLTPSYTFTPSNTPTPSDTPSAVYASLGAFQGELAHGERGQGVIISTFDRHIWALTARAGQYLNASASPNSDATADLALALYSPQGELIATSDPSDSTTARLRNLQLAQDGTYYLQVYSVSGTGSYALALALRDTPAP
jgi:hypothetical protein